MARSMTGFGRGNSDGPRYRVRVEIKAVNHRYLEVAPRIPRVAASLEDRLRKAVQARVERGRFDVFVDVNPAEDAGKQVKVDKALALAYYSALKDMQDELGISGSVEVSLLAGLPGVLSQAEAEEDSALLWQSLERALEAGLDGIIAMREREGETLSRDIISRIDKVGALVSEIKARAPVMVEQYRRKLDSRIKELLPSDALDEMRLAMEVALYADRVNIDEEIVRITSHLEQLKDALRTDGAVGRKMDFILQEINREINTIGSKAADTHVGSVVVEVKSELEKIREQVQNIE
ncbi:MAG: YicC family protein [Firmicutes bacterium]|nr:YicC family protein [Bacillota bacterium]